MLRKEKKDGILHVKEMTAAELAKQRRINAEAQGLVEVVSDEET